jgi:alpha-D-xyloside xylohydrolase
LKFSHGAWLWDKSVTPSMMKRVHEYHIDRGSYALTIAALDRTGTSGGDRFEGTVLELRVTSPMPDVIRVQVHHHSPAVPGPNGFDLDYGLAAPDVRIEDAANELKFTSGRLSLRLAKKSWQMMFEDDRGRPITSGGRDSLGYMRVENGGNHLMQRLLLDVDECIYGLGERFGPLAKNGQSISIWNEDGGTVSDLAYKSIPFYVSSRGYGLLVNTPGKVDFEIATERVSQVQFSVPAESLDYYVFYGPDLKDVLEKYTRLCGRPAVPPAWSFGLWLSTSFTTTYDERTVTEFIDGMASRQIPLSVFHFDCFWMKERHWCDFKWDLDAFPDPPAMLKRLKAKGLKVCLWINPYISQRSELFDEGRRNGYFLKRSDGSVFQRDAWQPGMALVDFTNPAAGQWYKAKLQTLLDMGADCFKTDFGEFIPTDVVYNDGSNPALMHNYYTYLYNKCVFELLERQHGKGNALVFARSATAGCQKFPVHWGGDCEATFESMAEDLRGGLSFCMSGAAFWSHDMGGFTGKADPALYKRWAAFGLLSTHSRLHGSESYRVPWLFDEESVAVVRHFVRLKNTLFPYLFAAAHEAAVRGTPVMRAMVVDFPDDLTCRHVDKQYMLGPSLLVAPVFRHDNSVDVYLPRGRWTNFFTNETITSVGQWRRETHDFFHLPLYVAADSVIAMSENEANPAWSADEALTLRVFPLSDGASVTTWAHPTSGDQRAAEFRTTRHGREWRVESNGVATKVHLLLPAMPLSNVSNGQIAGKADDRFGVRVAWTNPGKPIVLTAGE